MTTERMARRTRRVGRAKRNPPTPKRCVSLRATHPTDLPGSGQIAGGFYGAAGFYAGTRFTGGGTDGQPVFRRTGNRKPQRGWTLSALQGRDYPVRKTV